MIERNFLKHTLFVYGVPRGDVSFYGEEFEMALEGNIFAFVPRFSSKLNEGDIPNFLYRRLLKT